MSSKPGNRYETLVNINTVDDTNSLYDNDIIKLNVNGQIYTAHRKVLASKSTVFKKQLAKLAPNEHLEIHCIEGPILEALLSFLYSETVDESILKHSAVELWKAADKYQLEPLKQLCEASLCPNLSPSTVFQVLQLTHQHAIVRLKEVSIKYFSKNPAQIIDSNREKWASFIAQADTALLDDLLTELSPLVGQVQATNQKQASILARLRNESQGRCLEGTVKAAKYLSLTLAGLLAIAILVLLGIAILRGFQSGWFIALASFLLLFPCCAICSGAG